jgi:cystathionine gamma-synthase
MQTTANCGSIEMPNKPDLSPETVAAQAGGAVDPATGAIIPPIHLATTYERDADLTYPKGFIYGRPDNATIRQAEDVITSLEGGDQTLLLPSGIAAATTLFLSLETPAHVIAPHVMYWSLRNWLAETAPRFGIKTTFVDATDLDAIRTAIQPGRTRLIWLETPANPLWHISDIAAVAQIAHGAGAFLAVDSTCASPALTRPLALGADVVMHSATKYLNGHSDVLAGSLTLKATGQGPAIAERAAAHRSGIGSILGPVEAALLLRGMRTLFVRVARQSESALEIARAMTANAAVHEVLYPGLEDHPAHDLAKRQMTGGFGGMLSIRVAGGEAAAVQTAAALTFWKRATSLGGVESLVEHRASVEGAGSPCPPDLLRLSVGLENPADLVVDLQQALAQARNGL